MQFTFIPRGGTVWYIMVMSSPDVANKMPAIKILILKSLKMIVLQVFEIGIWDAEYTVEARSDSSDSNDKILCSN